MASETREVLNQSRIPAAHEIGDLDVDQVDGDELLDFIDSAIRDWRDVRDFKTPHRANEAGIAFYYIDAFQSVRSSIFGALLP